MSVKLNSYINFAGNTREVMEFYKSVFGGEVYFDTFGKHESTEMPVAPEDRDKIMHAFLKGENGVELMASDAPMGMTVDQGAQVSLTLNGDDETALRGYWEKLSEGAEVSVPLAPSPWGDTFGMLTDKYGIHWMVDIGPMQGE
jgi:PhnB protein